MQEDLLGQNEGIMRFEPNEEGSEKQDKAQSPEGKSVAGRFFGKWSDHVGRAFRIEKRVG